MKWWIQLDKTRGSRPRCILLMEGKRDAVATRMTRLIGHPEVAVSHNDKWMPYGRPLQNQDGSWDKTPAKEARLGDPNQLLPAQVQRELKSWWLAITKGANTPNWDIACTCSIRGKPGILLVEAKAHAKELSKSGKPLPKTINGWKNQKQIGRAIADAAAEFQLLTMKPWAISRDHHYQLSNRFAWSWKLVSLGIPVVLMYLGFLNAQDMSNDGPLFQSEAQWDRAVRDYCADFVDKMCWDKSLDFARAPLIPLIRVFDQPFDPNDAEAVD